MATNNALNNVSYPFEAETLTVDDGVSTDGYVQFNINSVGKFRWGIDFSDSTALVLSEGSALGTNNNMRMSTSGYVNFPRQPAMSSYLNVDTNNVTGNGATYTVGSSGVLIERYDQAGNFNPNGTFTAQTTGLFSIFSGWSIKDLSGTALTYTLQCVTSNRTYLTLKNLPVIGLNRGQSKNIAVLADLDAADTMTITCKVDGMPGDTADLEQGGTVLGYTNISVFLTV